MQEACSDVERACQTRAVIEVSNPDEDLERITEGSMWAVSDLAAPDMHRGTLLLRASARSHWQPLNAKADPQMCALLSAAPCRDIRFKISLCASWNYLVI